MTVTFTAPAEASDSIELNLAMSPDYGRYRFLVNGDAVPDGVDCQSPKLFWLHPKLGVFRLRKGENVLKVELVAPNTAAQPGTRRGSRNRDAGAGVGGCAVTPCGCEVPKDTTPHAVSCPGAVALERGPRTKGGNYFRTGFALGVEASAG
jgi:hypothetical protein